MWNIKRLILNVKSAVKLTKASLSMDVFSDIHYMIHLYNSVSVDKSTIMFYTSSDGLDRIFVSGILQIMFPTVWLYHVTVDWRLWMMGSHVIMGGLF